MSTFEEQFRAGIMQALCAIEYIPVPESVERALGPDELAEIVEDAQARFLQNMVFQLNGYLTDGSKRFADGQRRKLDRLQRQSSAGNVSPYDEIHDTLKGVMNGDLKADHWYPMMAKCADDVHEEITGRRISTAGKGQSPEDAAKQARIAEGLRAIHDLQVA